jgi:hypothetical protein
MAAPVWVGALREAVSVSVDKQVVDKPVVDTRLADDSMADNIRDPSTRDNNNHSDNTPSHPRCHHLSSNIQTSEQTAELTTR